MQRLCELTAVAVISGRGLGDLRQRLGFEPQHLVGNHGVESQAYQPGIESLAALESWRNSLQEHAEVFAEAGVLVEDKTYSFSLHFRRARDQGLALQTIKKIVKQLTPTPRPIGGKLVVNLLPPDAPDKYLALSALLRAEGRQTAFFMGDDVTDDIVFENAPPSWLTVRIERKEGMHARLYLYSQIEVATLIQSLISMLTKIRRP